MEQTPATGYGDLHDEFVDWLPYGGFEASGEVLHEGRNCVKAFHVGDEYLVVKRFRQPHKVNRVIYTLFRGTKAARAYRNGMRLLQLEVRTPQPTDYVDTRVGRWVSESYLVTSYCSWPPIIEIWDAAGKEKEELLDRFVKFTVWLHRKGVKHNDYNLTNILYHRSGDGIDFKLIDINRMKFGKLTYLGCASNLVRLSNLPREEHLHLAELYAAERGWNVALFRRVVAFLRWRFDFSRSLKISIRNHRQKRKSL